MAFLLFGLLLLIIFSLLIRLISQADTARLRRAAQVALVGLSFAVLVFALATRRFGLLVAVLPMVPGLLRRIGIFGTQRPATAAPPPSDAMDRSTALSILGLEAGASQAEILAAHRALMRENHPDRGGSDRVAQQLNAARDYLIGK